MKNFNENTRFTLDLLHASSPDGDDRTDMFTLKADGHPLFEIHIEHDDDTTNERNLTVRRLEKTIHASDLPSIHSTIHLGCVVYSFLVESLDRANDTGPGPEFYAELFYDADDNAIELPINLMNAATVPA